MFEPKITKAMKYAIQKQCLDGEFRDIPTPYNTFKSISAAINILNLFIQWNPNGNYRVIPSRKQ